MNTRPCEITLAELPTDYDWREVFGQGGGGNCNQDVESLDGTDTAVCPIEDVIEILAAVNGENDEQEWIGVFRMKDRRFLAACGSCDYTGWDCWAGNTLTVSSTLDNLLTTGLDPGQCKRLGFPHPAINEPS